MTPSPLRRAAPVACVALLLVGGLPTPAAHAAERVIQITADGPVPAVATVKAGDTIVFRNADPTFIHQVDEASPNWAFECGPLAPGAVCRAGTVTKPGEYLYEGVNLDDFTGRVVVPAPASAGPSPVRTAAPPPPSPDPQPTGGSPEPSPTAGNGSAGGPLFGGGLPSASPSAGGPAPDVAPAVPGGVGAVPSPAPSGPVVAVQTGRLPEPATARRYGLPAALAAVAAAGVGSLLVRLLLAHPAARRRSRSGSGPAVTVD